MLIVAGADDVHVSLMVSEPAPAHGKLVHVALSYQHHASDESYPSSSVCPDPEEDGSASSANHATTQKVSGQPTAANAPKAHESAGEAQPGIAAEQAVSKGAASGSCEQAETLVQPVVTSRASADSLASDGHSISKGLAGALSHLTSLNPLHWPIPSWNSDATSLPPAAAGVHTPADSPQAPESSQTVESCQPHATSEALASPNPPQGAAVASATARASTTNSAPDPAQSVEPFQPGNAWPVSESAQLLESAQQRHNPGPVSINNRLLAPCLPSSTASESSALLPAAADSNKDAVFVHSVSHRNGMQNHPHPQLAQASSNLTEAPVVGTTALEAPVHAQVAVPDLGMTHLKPEQQALLAKGLQLSMHVCEVTTPSPPPLPLSWLVNRSHKPHILQKAV